MAKARLHQSRYRAEVLQVLTGSVLTEDHGDELLNYYPKLGCREALRERYPNFSKLRDCNMLRSEHIPFNLFTPLANDLTLAKDVFNRILNILIETVDDIQYEYAPKPKKNYLNDGTAFDGYVEYTSTDGNRGAVGIEVKYTELAYAIKKAEKVNVVNPQSLYWKTTKSSEAFIEGDLKELGEDDLRQVWRNHILGLSMVQQGDLDEFYSVTLYPVGNEHFKHVIPQYKKYLKEESKATVLGITFEDFIEAIQSDDSDILDWKEYLGQRYIVK